MPHLAISSKDGVEVVEEANSEGELEKGLERTSARSEEPAMNLCLVRVMPQEQIKYFCTHCGETQVPNVA